VTTIFNDVLDIFLLPTYPLNKTSFTLSQGEAAALGVLKKSAKKNPSETGFYSID